MYVKALKLQTNIKPVAGTTCNKTGTGVVGRLPAEGSGHNGGLKCRYPPLTGISTLLYSRSAQA